MKSSWEVARNQQERQTQHRRLHPSRPKERGSIQNEEQPPFAPHSSLSNTSAHKEDHEWPSRGPIC